MLVSAGGLPRLPCCHGNASCPEEETINKHETTLQVLLSGSEALRVHVIQVPCSRFYRFYSVFRRRAVHHYVFSFKESTGYSWFSKYFVSSAVLSVPHFQTKVL